MNSSIFNRHSSYLVMLAWVATIIIVMAFSIELLYQFFQFAETILRVSARQVTHQYISYGY